MYAMTVDGKAADTGRTYEVVNPATGSLAALAPDCTPEQLDAALRSAERAQIGWAEDEAGRREAMNRLADAIVENADELVSALRSETGKPSWVAQTEPALCATWLRHYAAMELPRETLQDDDKTFIQVIHRPIGVVGAITPWNFPLVLSMWKIAPALRAGNTVVVKPSPFTPLAALVMGRIMGEVLPPGVVNTLSGGDQLGVGLVRSPIPRKISFTGSIAGGRAVGTSAMADLKRVTLELGGNDAAIVLADADPATVAAGLLGTAFFNTGQACALPKRVYVPETRRAEFVDAFAAAADAMSLEGSSAPAQGGMVLGPLSTRPQFDRVCELVDHAITNGATIAAGGKRADGPGFFFEPTIVTDVDDSSRLVAEEQFGPALPILGYATEDEALQRANASEYGLCGSVWSPDEKHASELAEQLQVGTTYVNTHATLLPTVPFGGWKHSGIGTENAFAGLLSFTDTQVLHLSRP